MPLFHEYICFQTGVAARTLHKYYNAKYESFGVTLAQSFILLALNEKDGLNIKKLAEYVFLESSAVTGLIDRMEKETLLERSTDPRDRRVFLIRLTPKGKNLAQEILPVAEEFNDNMKMLLDDAEWNGVMSFTKKIQEYCK